MYFSGAIRKKYLLFVVAFVSAMFFFTIFGGRGLIQIYHLKEEKERIKIVNVRLREENQKLAEQIERMKHSKEDVERIAREELGLVKKGEVVYQFER